MKKVLVFSFIVALVATSVFAADFSPTLLRLSAEETILYDFDDTELQIPVTVTGASASSLFLVYTKGQSDNIVMVTNGFLGWHYVNKIDTCLFVSNKQQLTLGSNTVKWDGKDSDGGKVPGGDYTYYLWAYDNESPKSQFVHTVYGARGKYLTHNEDGSPKDKPLWYIGTRKVTIGSDPLDDTLIETTTFERAEGSMGNPAFHPDDHSQVFQLFFQKANFLSKVVKYNWIPNGESTIDVTWGDDGEFVLSHDGAASRLGGVARVGDYLNYFNASDGDIGNVMSDLIYVDLEEGTLERSIDISEWYTFPDDVDDGVKLTGGPREMYQQDGYLLGTYFCFCMRGMFDPAREDDDDVVIWMNGNGDYVGDHNFEETAAHPWACNDFNVGPYAYSTGIDEHLFSTLGAYDLGAVTFGLIGPDGTGIDYFAFAGETAAIKDGPTFIDYGSAYDGMYTDNKTSGDDDLKGGTWFLGHDSIKGTITNGVGVADDTPAQFAVAQNSPNPFNPTTTISFSLVKASSVSVDIFNVAGQKVDTLVNEFMDSGSHSIVWDASDFSAGVYFYTVKSADFSKTIKMTLLK